ncbi:MAG: EAL domain-containing protein [Proteobacteria bacterium]|nr:EAL domain-containing protein [Pseudomonadota bacterium]
MDDSEELRETLVVMRQQVEQLRTEATHANLLLSALDAMLETDAGDDPFTPVFAILTPIFECHCILVLNERNQTPGSLECVATNRRALLGTLWPVGKLLAKALSGHVVSTLSGSGIEAWPDGVMDKLSRNQPALYLPIAVHGSHGVMLLLRDVDQPGFDRTHAALARKFSLLASHALAARRANLATRESHRLRNLTAKLKASQEALLYRANHDQLTGLPNRTHIREQINVRLANKSPGGVLALAYVDIDGFKHINDMHGHAVGDALLMEVARRIQAELRSADLLGRISGDEFIIAFDPVDERADLARFVQRIQSRVQLPMPIENAEVHPSISIGVAFYPEHGLDYETLRRHADLAMYRVKSGMKGGVSFFTHDLGRNASQKLIVERRIKHAIDAREFHCALQRKVNIRNGAIVGFEALARWVDADGVAHEPSTFLSIAAKLDLLDDITEHVVTDLLRHLPALDAKFGSHLRYSVNISAAQAMNIPFMLKLLRRISHAERHGRFTLEITEESFASSGPFLTHILPTLRACDISVSLDDFGAGYSSLAKLSELIVDEIKLDRSLVASIHQRPRSQVILRAVESLGATLNIPIVAEGIETNAENDYFLEHTGIAIGQGFLYHKPQLLRGLLQRT